ncbi:zinc finger C4H2 domain-containing protein isoform X3 [Bombyx mori]|uniref:Zinc finger C4H2 domain-containing protein n=1 Tax=Bombyx mori TaxID=7091 RepID=A0A8R2M7V9_BOMMO|nr:zinc finger C4H2 domain-containing protein isoform X3 [Bombyx mori]
MTAENEREIYHKLEAMKEIRNKTITLERLKRSIMTEVRSGDQEGRCLAQYKREMELLQQEKMSHVEELRQIHADINAMETVIKQTEESMTRKLSSASRLHEEYRPLKAEVDLLRRQYLGLERLPDLHEEDGSPITPDRFPRAVPPPPPRGCFPPLASRKPPPPPAAFRSALEQDFITVSLSTYCARSCK